VALAGLAAEGVSLRQSLARETVRTAQLSAQRLEVEKRLGQEGLVVTEASQAELAAQVTAANEMINRRFFSWSNLLAKLEQATPSGVSLISLLPQPASASLALRGEALTLDRLTLFVGKLQETAPFHDVFLSDQKGQGDGTVSFSINVRY